jgi:hypothetical protein
LEAVWIGIPSLIATRASCTSISVSGFILNRLMSGRRLVIRTKFLVEQLLFVGWVNARTRERGCEALVATIRINNGKVLAQLC